jgi:hypothetical protein
VVGLSTAPAYAASGSNVVAWGSSFNGEESEPATVPAGLADVVAVTGGVAHTLALRADGTVAAWGDAGPVGFTDGLTGITQIASTGWHSLALGSDGSVVDWSADGAQAVPARVTGITQVAAGWEHNLAVRADGTVVAWGDNRFRESTVPTGLSGVTRVAAGFGHSLALRVDGTVVGWGRNEKGQATVPAGLSGVVQIAAGTEFSVALKSDGTVVAWGLNNLGQSTVPAGLSGVVQIAAGGNHTLALKSDGTVVAWGTATDGQSTVPAGLSGVTAVGVGTDESLAVAPTVAFEPPPPGRPHEPVGETSVPENAGVVSLTVSRAGHVDQQLSVGYRTSGTATPAADFTLPPGKLTFARGEVTTTIALTVNDDRQQELAETVVLTLSSPSQGTSLGMLKSVTVIIEASDQQPDAWVSTAPDSGYIGNNVYNTTGADQTKTLTARAGQPRAFYVRIYNDGNDMDTLTVRGVSIPTLAAVRYLSGTTDITARMQSQAGFTVARLRPGAFRLIEVRITPGAAAAVGSVRVARVSATWTGDSVRADLARAVVRVTG